jgi:hypothetical protein
VEVSYQLHAPAALFPEKESPLLFDKRLGGSQSRSGRDGKEKNSQPPPEIKPPNPDRPVRSQSLYGLSYPGEPLNVYTRQCFIEVRMYYNNRILVHVLVVYLTSRDSSVV